MVKPNLDATVRRSLRLDGDGARGNVSAMAARACAGHIGPARASRQNSPRAREVSNAGAKRGTLRGRIQCTPSRLGGPPVCFGSKSHANGLHKLRRAGRRI
jgi:hypothetical protein